MKASYGVRRTRISVLVGAFAALAVLSQADVWAQSPLDEARLLLESHMPVSAGALLARELSRGGVAGDEAVVLAARAYAEQRSWTSARRLLAGRPFADPDHEKEAALLLARAYAGLDSATLAVGLYRSVIDRTPTPVPLDVRAGFADVLGQDGRWGDAVRQLELAADEHPDLARWIRLSRLYAMTEAGAAGTVALADSLARAPGVPADSALLPAARLAFETDEGGVGVSLVRRAGSGVRAALAAEHEAPYWLARGDTARAADAYRAALAGGRISAETGPSLLALDGSWRSLRDVGRSDAGAGRNERAARFLEVALDLAPESERPEIAELLAGAHAGLGNPTRAIQVLGPWIGDRGGSRSDRSSLWLLAAGLFTSLGQPLAAAEAYETAAAGTGNSAARAAYLIGDAHHDAGRLEEARGAFDRSYRRFPGSSYGSRSLERLALLDFHEGRYADARTHLDEYRRRYRRGSWYQGAIYWTAKTEEARGDAAAARTLYLETVGHDPLDYYAILAAPRVGRDRWTAVGLVPDEEIPALAPRYAAALERMNRLRETGWVARARVEYREARADGPSDPSQVLAFAHALNAAGWTQEGIAEGWRAQSRGRRWSRPLLEAIYPLPFREALSAAARDRGLAPHLVAGLSRRESMFDPEIMSVANAVGLMQLLPQTARDVSARAGLPEYRRSQLTVPQVNLLLGTRYLADVLERFDGQPVAGMISYNAGPHRYVRWREFPEFADPEQLVERIPFRETREYVRAVTELSEIYRFLYPDLERLTP